MRTLVHKKSSAALLVVGLSLGLTATSLAQSTGAQADLAALQQAKRLQLANALANTPISPTPTRGQISQIAQSYGSPNVGAMGVSVAGVGGLSAGSISATGLLRSLELLAEQIRLSENAPAPSGWARYAHYNNGNLTPTPVTVAAHYDGLVRGTSGTGTALGGTAHFDVDVTASSADFDGRFVFDGGDTVTLSNYYYRGQYGVFVDANQPFMGGNIDYTTFFDSKFYGPNAEQYGGDWAFMVSGGSDPGIASGQFVTAR
nr:hypothetical protein [uncultured Devosia sp.]